MTKRGLPFWVWAFVLALAITAATFSFVRQYEVHRAQADFRASAVQRIDLLQANIALATKSRLEWDGKAERFTNNEAANNLLDYEYRAPWSHV